MCTIQYTKGAENVVPDGLSRRSDLFAAMVCYPTVVGDYDCSTESV